MAQSAEELRREIANTRADLSGTLDAIGDRVSPGRVMERKKNRMTSSVRSVRDRVMGTAQDARTAVMGSAHDARAAVSNEAHALGGSLAERKDNAMTAVHNAPSNLTSTVSEKTEGAPMLAGALAFGIGFLVAAAIPATRAETKAGSAMLDKIEPIKGELSSVGQDMAQHLKEPVTQAATAVKEAATEHAQAVAGTAKDAAQQTREQATSAVDAVKSPGTT